MKTLSAVRTQVTLSPSKYLPGITFIRSGPHYVGAIDHNGRKAELWAKFHRLPGLAEIYYPARCD